MLSNIKAGIFLFCLSVTLMLGGCGGSSSNPSRETLRDATPRFLSAVPDFYVVAGTDMRIDAEYVGFLRPVTRIERNGVIIQETTQISGEENRALKRVVNTLVRTSANNPSEISGTYRVIIADANASNDAVIFSEPFEVTGQAAGEAPADATLPTAEQASWISGLYSAVDIVNGERDEGYLYIDPTGDIVTFDYRNDAVDNDGNCYLSPVPEGKPNHEFVGEQIYWRENGGYFPFFGRQPGGPFEYSFRIDENNEPSLVCRGGDCTTGFSLEDSSENRVVVLNVRRDDSIQISDILSALCE